MIASTLNINPLNNWLFDSKDIPSIPVEEAKRTITGISTIQGITTIKF